MTAPAPPLSLLPTCSVWIDGVRFADGCTPGETDTTPVALTDLKVVWGRDNTLDQPEPGTCSFQVLDVVGGVLFTDQLHIGTQVDVRAEATIYPDPTTPIFTYDAGFEGMTVGAVPPSSVSGGAVTVSTEQAHTGTKSARLVPTGRPQTVIFPPAPFGNDSAWDAVPRTFAGQTWRFGASIWLSQAGYARIRPVGFTRPDPSTAFRINGFDLLPDVATIGWQVLAGDVLPPPEVWLGVAVELTAPQWDEVDPYLTWDDLPGAVTTRTNLVVDPRFTSTTGKTKSASTNANAAASILTGVGVQGGIDTAYRATTVASQAATANWYVGAANVVTAPVVGSYYRAGAWVRRSVAGQMYLRMVNVSGSSVNGPSVAVSANTWTWLTVGGVVTAGATAISYITMPGAALALTAGDTLDVTGLVMEQVIDATAAAVPMTPADYFDGSTPDTAEIDYAWTGTANASTSTATPKVAALHWDDMGLAYVDDLVLLAPAEGALRRSTVFSGRITDLQSQYDLDVGGTIVDVTAQTHLAELNNRYVGAEPWLAESLADRFAHIVTASGQTVEYLIDSSVQNLPVTWRDVDNQPSGDLLHQLAQSVAGALWSASSDVGEPYIWLEDINRRPSQYVLVMQGGVIVIAPSTEVDPERIVVIDACDVLLEPVIWSQSTEDNATRVVVSWQDQTLDDEGNPKPTSRDVTADDAQAEARSGRRRIQISTQLASSTDAVLVAQAVLARVSTPGWRVSGLTWEMVTTDRLDADTLDIVMQLLDGVSKLGIGIRLVNMPTWLPPASGADVNLFLEGGTYRNIDGAWVLELQTSSAISQGASNIRWDDLPGAVTPVATRTNRATNPRAISGGSTGWEVARGFGTGGAGSYSYTTGIGTPPLGNVSTARRKTWSTGASNNGDTGFQVGASSTQHLAATVGTAYTVSAYVRHTSGGNKIMRMKLAFLNQTTMSGASFVGGYQESADYTIATGLTWTRIAMTATCPAGAAAMSILVDVQAGGVNWAAGNTLDATALLVEAAAAPAKSYFDGALVDAPPLDYSWTAAANNSTSTAVDTTVPITGWRWDDVDPSINWDDLHGVGLES